MRRWSLFLIILSVGISLFAQSAGPIDLKEVEALYKQADDRAQKGDFKSAIEIYEAMVKKFPNISAIWQLQYNLGFCYYLAGQNDKAIATFQKVTSKDNPDEKLRERAALILCSAQSNLAQSQTDPAKKAQMLTGVIDLYNKFLRDYPKSDFRPDAFYGKAVASLQADKPDDAEKNLQEYFKKEKESLKMEANYLLARIFTAQGRKLDGDKKVEEAKAKYKKAKDIYDKFISISKDLVLVNESLLSAGDVMIKNGNYADAIRMLHNVKPRQYIEKRQLALLESIRGDLFQAMTSQNAALIDDIKQQYQRVKNRLVSIQIQDTIFFKAQQLVSQAYFNQQKYDEALILSRHMLPYYPAEDKKLTNYLIIKALVGKNSYDKAVEEYATFEKTYPKDPLIEDLIITLARATSKESKYDECIKWAERYKSTYPSGVGLEEIYFMVADTYTRAGKSKEAQQASDAFRAKFPNSPLASQALFYKALSLFNNRDYQNAAADFRAFVSKYPDHDNTKYALINMADCYTELKLYPEAIKVLKEFESKYSKTDSYSAALYKMAKAEERNKNFIVANALYTRVVKEYPTQDMAPYSQYAMAINFLTMGQEHSAESVAAFDQFIQLFPKHILIPNVYFFKAEIFRTQKKNDEAVAAYQDIVAKFPDSESAGDALVACGDIFSQQITSMTSKPEKLSAEKQELWKSLAQKAQDFYEQVVKNYPNNSSVDKALSQLSRLWESRIKAKFNVKDDATSYFNKLSSSSNPALQIKVSFTLGGLMGVLNEQEAALVILTKAYEKSGAISLPNEGYKQYRAALLTGKEFDKAKEVSERQLREKREAGDDRGIAEALLGLGQACFEKSDFITAAKNLSEVVSKYPWHETAANEAEFLLVLIEEKNKNYDEAINRFKALAQKIREPELKVKIFLHTGHIWLSKSENASQGKLETLKEALGYFLKVGTAFKAYGTYAAEAQYMSGSLYEKYGNLTDDARAKSESGVNAIKFYKMNVDDFPTSPWADKSRERLKALGK